MVKDATTLKTRLSAPATFWASLLVSTAIVNCLPSQASPYPTGNGIARLHANEVPETVATSSMSLEAAAVEAAAKAPTVGDETSIDKLTSDRKDSDTNKVQGTVATQSPPTLQTVPAQVSAEAPTVENVPAVAEKAKIHTDKVVNEVQGTVATAPPPTLQKAPAKVSTEVPTLGDFPSVDDNFSNPEDMDSNDPMSQVTNVTQLRDVSPGDWAYEALRSLVERYGCIAGYPDGTYRGNRALSRYEFAAGLNACLQQVERLIASGAQGLATRRDLETLQRLVEEFQPELATLGTRLDKLEGRTAFLEDHQFSTTTKMFGAVDLVAANVFGEKKPVPSGQSPTEDLKVNPTFASRSFFILNTSFTGKDLLQTILAAGNTNRLGREITGTDMTAYNPNVAVNTQNGLVLGSVFYQFPISDRLTGFISPGTTVSLDFFPKLNPANSISAFGQSNPVYRLFDYTGGGSIIYKPSDLVTIQLGYGDNTFRLSNPSNGLFNDKNTYGAQVLFTPNKPLSVGLSYIHYYSPQPGPIFNATGGTGSLFAQAPFGENTATEVKAFGLQGSYRFSERFSLGGWVGYIQAKADSSGQVQGVNVSQGDEADIWNWAVTAAFRDLGKKGSQLNFIFGTPPWVANNEVTSRVDRDRSYHIEASYSYPLHPRILITPGFFVIINPEHNNNNDPIWLGMIQTTFYF